MRVLNCAASSSDLNPSGFPYGCCPKHDERSDDRMHAPTSAATVVARYNPWHVLNIPFIDVKSRWSTFACGLSGIERSACVAQCHGRCKQLQRRMSTCTRRHRNTEIAGSLRENLDFSSRSWHGPISRAQRGEGEYRQFPETRHAISRENDTSLEVNEDYVRVVASCRRGSD